MVNGNFLRYSVYKQQKRTKLTYVNALVCLLLATVEDEVRFYEKWIYSLTSHKRPPNMSSLGSCLMEVVLFTRA